MNESALSDLPDLPSVADAAPLQDIARAFVASHDEPVTPVSSLLSMLPFSYLRSFYVALLETGLVRLHSFNELQFPPDADLSTEEGLKTTYAEEFKTWAKTARASEEPRKLDLFLLHDCDSAPLETQYMLGLEGELGMRSTTSVFVRERDGRGNLRNYGIDYDVLKRLQDDKGLSFSYHCNAAEVALYDEELVRTTFNDDIEFLHSKGLDIRCFSPHGGVAGPGGLNNYSYFYPAFSRRLLYWTHNKYAPSGRRYSDGGMHARLPRNDASLDIRAFFKTLLEARAPGAVMRCFMLIHPQYYFAKDAELATPHLATNAWLAEFWDLHRQGRESEYWAPVRAALESSFGSEQARG